VKVADSEHQLQIVTQSGRTGRTDVRSHSVLCALAATRKSCRVIDAVHLQPWGTAEESRRPDGGPGHRRPSRRRGNGQAPPSTRALTEFVSQPTVSENIKIVEMFQEGNQPYRDKMLTEIDMTMLSFRDAEHVEPRVSRVPAPPASAA
jgi:hypothetical protein